MNAPCKHPQAAFARLKALFKGLFGAFQRANAPDKRLQGAFKPVKPAVGCCAAAFRRLFGAFQRANAPDKRLSGGNGCLKAAFQGIIQACHFWQSKESLPMNAALNQE
ncbi:hypothetical protein [Candidatus Electronema sp. JC]|uniref:hypothetical protein n=1 Tax=Candidatus Electronema sp. JC TaxID=3401570 RepID=UPI003B43A295